MTLADRTAREYQTRIQIRLRGILAQSGAPMRSALVAELNDNPFSEASSSALCRSDDQVDGVARATRWLSQLSAIEGA